MLFILSGTSTCESTEIIIVAGDIGKQSKPKNDEQSNTKNQETGKWKEKCDLKGKLV